MTNILLVLSSPLGGESPSTRFATEVAEALKVRSGGEVTIRDLATTPLPHIIPRLYPRPPCSRGRAVRRARGSRQSRAEARRRGAEGQCHHPRLWNYQFRSFVAVEGVVRLHHRPGVTFLYEEAGPKGIVPSKNVYLVTAAGALYSDGQYTVFDHQTNYLMLLLQFMGLTDVEMIRLEGTYLGPDAAEATIKATEAQIAAVLDPSA